MKQFRSVFSMLAGFVYPMAAFSVTGSEATLCQAFEEVYFSCEIDEKIIAICALGNISPANGYVQYRYGTRDKLELQYPSKPLDPKGLLTISEISEGDAQYTQLKFRQNGFNYVVYQGIPSGIYVKRNGRTIFNRVCGNGKYQALNQRVYRGMETVPPEDGVDQ